MEWVFHVSLVGYILQSSFLLKVRQSLAFRFIWGGQREVAWASMVVLQEEGGAGLGDFH